MSEATAINYEALHERLQHLFSNLKVLVVDDMPTNIDNIRLLLLRLGVQRSHIQTATNGLDAFTRIASFKPHLVTADWNMPVMNGLEFAKKVRAVPQFESLLIVMLTAEAELDLEQARPYVNAFLRKPATNATIEKMLLSVLGKKVLQEGHPLQQLNQAGGTQR